MSCSPLCHCGRYTELAEEDCSGCHRERRRCVCEPLPRLGRRASELAERQDAIMGLLWCSRHPRRSADVLGKREREELEAESAALTRLRGRFGKHYAREILREGPRWFRLHMRFCRGRCICDGGPSLREFRRRLRRSIRIG